jgi:hypothetical protein
MKAIPPYTAETWLNDFKALAAENCQSQTLPFTRNPPLPENTDIIRHWPLRDANAVKLELQAASMGIDRLTWVFGADAELLGLTLPPHFASDPVLVFARIQNREGNPLDAQYAYFIDQFSEASVNRLATASHTETTENREVDSEPIITDRRSLLAIQALLGLQNYDSGVFDVERQRKCEEHLRENTREGTAGFTRAKQAYARLTRNYSPEEKELFTVFEQYTAARETGQPVMGTGFSARKERITRSCQTLLPRVKSLASLLSHARLFAYRLTSPGGNLERTITPFFGIPGTLRKMSPETAPAEPGLKTAVTPPLSPVQGNRKARGQ